MFFRAYVSPPDTIKMPKEEKEILEKRKYLENKFKMVEFEAKDYSIAWINAIHECVSDSSVPIKIISFTEESIILVRDYEDTIEILEFFDLSPEVELNKITLDTFDLVQLNLLLQRIFHNKIIESLCEE